MAKKTNEEPDIEEETEIEEKQYDLSIVSDQVDMFRDKLDEKDIQAKIAVHINKILNDYKLDKYHIVFLYDEHNSIGGFHSDRIYRSISDLKNTKDILMFIESGGGQIEPAYLISKNQRGQSN